MIFNKIEFEINIVAKQIMKQSPKMSKDKALNIAIDICMHRITAEIEYGAGLKSSWKDLPEHIKANIIRQRKAEVERKAQGRSLPARRKVSGGKVSPR